MVPNALIISRDEQLAGELQAYLREDFACKARVAPDCRAAAEDLGRNLSPALFLDLRSEAIEAESAKFLSALPSQQTRPAVIFTLSDRGYLRAWMSQVNGSITGHVSLPIDRQQLAEALRNGNGRAYGQVKNGRSEKHDLRIVESKSVRFVTHSPELFAVLDQLERVAPHDVTLLLVGETGSGKTTLAQLVHQLSPRASERFTTVACGALPPDLIESELFGHVRGAFTGADRAKLGRFEAAERGTLLLDEIDVLGPKEQAKLLRVIETGEFEPVGSPETRTSQARLIVASNVDLKGLVEQGIFRSDLYYRLNVLEFHLPPLRERPLDIVPMALEFIEDCSRQFNIPVDRIRPEFLTKLKSYRWPGNIRELKNQIRRAVLFVRDGELTAEDLTLPILDVVHGDGAETPAPKSWRLADQVELSEREILEEALRAHNYKRTATAHSLGISRVGLYKKMRKYGMLKLNGNGNGNGHGNGHTNGNGNGHAEGNGNGNGHGNGNGNGNGNGHSHGNGHDGNGHSAEELNSDPID